MKPSDLLTLLGEFLRDKASLRDRHVAAARAVAQYDCNNAYQYIIAREDQHLTWAAEAIGRLGGDPPGPRSEPPAGTAASPGPERTLIGEDARLLDEFIQRWRGRVALVTNAREQRMLDLVLGETAEHARLFRQAASGQLDILGRRTGGERTGGKVLPTRWAG